MAKRVSIPSKHVELKLVGPTDSLLVSRVQRVGVTADQATNTIDELGNPQHAGTSKDVPNVTLTFQLMDVGIKAAAVLTGNSATAFPGAGVDLGTDLKELEGVVMVREQLVADYIKTMHLRRCSIQSLALNYSVDGDSTEEYTAIGSTKRWFTKDVVVQKFTTGATTFALAETPIQLKNSDYALTAILDSVYLTEVSVAPATGEYQIVGTTLTTFDTRTSQLIVLYQADPAGNNWSDVNDQTVPASVRGKDAVIKINADSIDRVQSLTINANYNLATVKEMGNREIVGYTAQVPEITGTLTVLDTDTELIQLFTGGAPSDTEFKTGECSASGISLTVELYDPEDCTSPYGVLKTVHLSSISITSEGFTSNVNENAQQTFDWRSDDASLMVYSGAMP